MRQFRLAFGALIAAILCAAPALAQSYPARPIRLVVPFGAGGGTDNLARIIEPLVTKALGQPLVIENRPGGIGASTHLGGELLKFVAGIDVRHVPYKGTGPAMNDLIGGHVQVMFAGISSARPFMDAGTLRALAVTGEARNAAVPDVPTFAEAGLPGVSASTYWGVLAPKGTPQEIVAQISAA